MAASAPPPDHRAPAPLSRRNFNSAAAVGQPLAVRRDGGPDQIRGPWPAVPTGYASRCPSYGASCCCRAGPAGRAAGIRPACRWRRWLSNSSTGGSAQRAWQEAAEQLAGVFLMKCPAHLVIFPVSAAGDTRSSATRRGLAPEPLPQRGQPHQAGCRTRTAGRQLVPSLRAPDVGAHPPRGCRLGCSTAARKRPAWGWHGRLPVARYQVSIVVSQTACMAGADGFV